MITLPAGFFTRTWRKDRRPPQPLISDGSRSCTHAPSAHWLPTIGDA